MIGMMQMMAAMIDSPLLAAIPAGVFYCLFVASRRRFILAVAILWLVYLVYEWGIKLRILCSGDCAIRIDLVVLYPALLFLSIAALVVFAAHKLKRRAPR